ncbi:MAG: hypothetical protein R2822_05385 [Spirosomataceae bacterium]
MLFYFTPFVFDVTLWGINGISIPLNLLVFATLYILANYSKILPTCLAIVLAFAATFTNGNGFLVFPAGLAILLLAKEWKKALGGVSQWWWRYWPIFWIIA